MTKIGITKVQDKVLHFGAGIILGIVGQVLFSESILMIAPIVIGAVGKELYDEIVKDTEFDFFDMFVTLVGGFVGIAGYGLFL